MSKIVGKIVQFDSYDEYVERQNSKFHDYDCQNCLKMNIQNMEEALRCKPSIKTMLDLGSRDSAYFDIMAEKGIKCMGIDITLKSVSYAVSKGRDVVEGDAAKASQFFNERFDLILSNHSFEHFLKPEMVLMECQKLLKDDGILLIRLPDEHTGFRDPKTLHTRVFNRNDLLGLFDKSSFNIKEELAYPSEFFFILEKMK